LLYSGVLQASFESPANESQIQSEDSCGNFETVGSFSEGKVKAFIEKAKKVNCLGILVTQKQERHLFFPEIDVGPA